MDGMYEKGFSKKAYSARRLQDEYLYYEIANRGWIGAACSKTSFDRRLITKQNQPHCMQ